MRRKDLLEFLVDRPQTPSQIARLAGLPRQAVEEELRHLLRSLVHTRYVAEVTPARCRQCGFRFGPDKLHKPSRCPQCRSTWLAEPRIGLRERGTAAPGTRPAAAASVPATKDEEAPPWLEPLNHTADAGIIVRADDLASLFSRAAWGMFSLLTDVARVEPRNSEVVRLEGGDREGLLVQWLSELNFRHVTRRELYSRFDVREVNERLVDAQVWGEPIDATRHTVYTEIKAVTFHGLRVEQSTEGWRAQIIFDL
jgi:SHS2 domain-containing protein/predicted Zn-ribbon and HTH transcriptional regulator